MIKFKNMGESGEVHNIHVFYYFTFKIVQTRLGTESLACVCISFGQLETACLRIRLKTIIV